MRWAHRLARSRGYLHVLQFPTLLGFAWAVYLGLAGPRDGSENPATVFLWLLWWPGLALIQR